MLPKEACKFIVGLLHLAVTCGCEKALGESVVKAINLGENLSLNYFQKLFCKKQDTFKDVTITQHSLEHYNQLIPHYVKEFSHAAA